MQAAFQRAGFKRAKMQAYAWANQFINEGGTREEWIEAFDLRAAELRGEGQGRVAQEGQASSADPALPTPGTDQSSFANEGQSNGVRSGSPIPSGSGQPDLANRNGQQPRSVPAREPSVARIAAMGRARTAAAQSLFDLRKTSDGRAWGDVTYGELASMTRDGDLARSVARMCGSVPTERQADRVRKLISAQQFEEAIAQAERANAA